MRLADVLRSFGRTQRAWRQFGAPHPSARRVICRGRLAATRRHRKWTLGLSNRLRGERTEVREAAALPSSWFDRPECSTAEAAAPLAGGEGEAAAETETEV